MTDDKELDDLVRRLTAAEHVLRKHHLTADIGAGIHEAADAIAALRAESADLRADLDACRSALRAASRAAEVTPPAAAPPTPAADLLP